MTITFKKCTSLILLTILFTFASCEKDLYQEAIKTQSRTTSQKFSIDQVLNEIDNIQIKNYINNEFKQDFSFSKFKKKNEDYSNFIKIIKENEYITYSFLINDYSKDKPFFKYLIITKNKATEKAGFAKFIPNSPVAFFDEKHFSGTLQVFDLKNNIKGETQFINGVVQVKNTKSKIASKSATCTNTYSIIAHNCTNGGNHSPGTSCNNGATNDGYYEIVVGVICTASSVQYIAEPDSFMGMSTGGGGNSLSFNENVLLFLYSLTEEEYAVTVDNPSIVAYLEHNDSSPESQNIAIISIYSILSDINNKSFINNALLNLIDGSEVDFTYKVIVDQSLKDNANLYGVYTQLGKAPIFQAYLQKFDSKFSIANLKLSVDNQFGNKYKDHLKSQAVTLTPENYLVRIVINNDLSLPSNIMKFPKIVSPIIFVHEMMHAEINRILLTCSKLPNVNTENMTDEQWGIYLKNIQNDFPKLYQYYLQYELNTKTPTGYQHEYMAERYRNVIKDVLKQYDNNAHSTEFYNTLSWFGLKGTAAWTNLSQAQKDQINVSLQKIYQDEPYFN